MLGETCRSILWISKTNLLWSSCSVDGLVTYTTCVTYGNEFLLCRSYFIEGWMGALGLPLFRYDRNLVCFSSALALICSLYLLLRHTLQQQSSSIMYLCLSKVDYSMLLLSHVPQKIATKKRFFPRLNETQLMTKLDKLTLLYKNSLEISCSKNCVFRKFGITCPYKKSLT